MNKHIHIHFDGGRSAGKTTAVRDSDGIGIGDVVTVQNRQGRFYVNGFVFAKGKTGVGPAGPFPFAGSKVESFILEEMNERGSAMGRKITVPIGKVTKVSRYQSGRDAAQKGWLQIIDAPLSAQRAGKLYEWRLKSGPGDDYVARGVAETWDKAKAAGIAQARSQGFSTQFGDAGKDVLISTAKLNEKFRNGEWEAVTDRFGSYKQYQEVVNITTKKRFTVLITDA